MNGPLLQESESPWGFFSAAQGGFRAGKKKLRSPERALCSPGMPETRRPAVHQHQCPHTPRNMWGRVEGWMVEGWMVGGVFRTLQPHWDVFILSVDVVRFRWGEVTSCVRSVFITVYFMCVCLNRGAEGIRAFLDFLVLLVIVARRATE